MWNFERRLNIYYVRVQKEIRLIEIIHKHEVEIKNFYDIFLLKLKSCVFFLNIFWFCE
jgi:hypothetical protein